MGQVLSTFGIDWRLLVINMANFALLLFVLTYYLYKPLTRMLEERRQKVAQGVRDADLAAKKLREVEAQKSSILASAGKEADEVLAHARRTGSQKEREMLAQSEEAASAMLKEAEAQAHEMKVQAIEESKQEVAKLVVLGMERALTKK